MVLTSAMAMAQEPGPCAATDKDPLVNGECGYHVQVATPSPSTSPGPQDVRVKNWPESQHVTVDNWPTETAPSPGPDGFSETDSDHLRELHKSTVVGLGILVMSAGLATSFKVLRG